MFSRVFSGMSQRGGAMLRVAIGLLACLVAFGACAVTGGGTGGSTTSGGTATPTPKPCSTHATTTALTYDSGPNLAGAIPAPPGAPTSPLGTISNFVYPLGIPDEGAVGNSPQLSFTAIAPDAAHLAVAVLQIVPFQEQYNPYIVDTATHAVTRIMLANPIYVANSNTAPRLFAWADTHTLIIFASSALYGPTSGPSYSYDINTKALTPLPGVTNAIEGVVRCGVLFYSALGTFSGLGDVNHTQVAPVSINRYDLGTNSAIGAPIDIGKASTYGGAEGEITYPGWDASPDGQPHRLPEDGGRRWAEDHLDLVRRQRRRQRRRRHPAEIDRGERRAHGDLARRDAGRRDNAESRRRMSPPVLSAAARRSSTTRLMATASRPGSPTARASSPTTAHSPRRSSSRSLAPAAAATATERPPS